MRKTLLFLLASAFITAGATYFATSSPTEATEVTLYKKPAV